MSHWNNETVQNNWVGKYRRYPIYAAQAKEVRADIRKISKEFPKSPTILDVCGGDGRLKTPNTTIIDTFNGFDVTKDWGEQGLKGKFDIVMSSISLLVFSEEDLNFIVSQMQKFSKKYIYIYEEAPTAERECGAKIDEDFGGKYSHIWSKHFGDALWGGESKINNRWCKYLYKK